MCMNSSTPIPGSYFFYSFWRRRPSKRQTVCIRRLNRWRRTRRGVGAKKLEIKNLKLYIMNKSIQEENERLRRKALLLHQENQTLLAQLQKKLCNSHTAS